MPIPDNCRAITKTLKDLAAKRNFPEPIALMVVSKYYSDTQVQEAIDAGQTLFGENKVIEGTRKINTFKKPGQRWHLIGHLQRNKVKKAVQAFDCIQSVDSFKLAHKINQTAESLTKTIDILLQVNVANDEQKHGFNCEDILENDQLRDEVKTLFNLKNIRVRGMMMMAPFDAEESRLKAVFSQSRHLYEQLKGASPTTVDTLSMGMSNDYQLAINCGSTLIRLGRGLTT